MKVYVITANNDPASNENSYCIGVFTSLDGVISQLWTFIGNRDVAYQDVETKEWGARHYFYDNFYNDVFTIDVETMELDGQNFYI